MLVDVKNVSKRFMGTNVLDDITISIKKGDRIAVMGPNGAGKTTLVRAMLGFYHIDSGEIKVQGFNPVQNRVAVLEHISFIPQLPPPVKLSIDELITYVGRSSGVEKVEIYQEAQKMQLDLKEHGSKPFFKLSGGMKQKLLISIALAKKSELLIFDEPTANLDPKARENFYQRLTEVEQSVSTLFITHRLDEIEGLVNRKIYMDFGKVIEDEKI